MTTIPFTKMHGIGNDYIYVDCTKTKIENPAELSIKLSHRHFAIGGDGLILISPSTTADFEMRIFNADGSEAEMCGNGIRCVGKFVYDRGLKRSTTLRIDTKAGVKVLQLYLKNGEVSTVRVDLGEPSFDPASVPALAEGEMINYPIEVDGKTYHATVLSVGNPHAVIFVPKITDELVLGVGPKIENHPLFPKRLNVEFVEVISPKEFRMRVWERGSGETFACGTGASAVIPAAVRNELGERTAVVHLLGGDLEIEWGSDNRLYKTGPATIAFDGTVTV